VIDEVKMRSKKSARFSKRKNDKPFASDCKENLKFAKSTLKTPIESICIEKSSMSITRSACLSSEVMMNEKFNFMKFSLNSTRYFITINLILLETQFVYSDYISLQKSINLYT
jgi:hypothetical protein